MQPLWTHFFLIALICMACFSISKMPRYLDAAKNMRVAEAQYKAKDYVSAEQHYEAAIGVIPGANDAKVGLVKALFAQKLPEKDEKAAKLLPDTTFTSSDKVDVLNIAPQKYWAMINRSYRSSE